MSKHAIVAGVGPGIGLAVARRFAREGYVVSLLARNAGALATYRGDILAEDGRAGSYPADLYELASIRSAIEAAVADHGAADVLVYNAARWDAQPAMQIDPALFTRELALCATGALACAQRVHPGMKRAGRGSMIFTGGGLALFPRSGAGVAALTAGKSALRGLVLAMADELAPDGIHVAMVTVAGQVAPGTAFDPDLIAEQYWDLHQQPGDAWEVERIVQG